MATQSSVSFSYQKTIFQMLHKFCAWTQMSNFDQSQHKNWTKSVTNAWPCLEKSKENAFSACKSRLNFRIRGQFEIKISIVRLMNTSYFTCILKKIELEPVIIRKVVTCQPIISKKYSNSVGRYLSPRYGQAILVSGYTVLTAVNWSQHGQSHGCTISGCRLLN